jgi:hypothetical protein
MATTSSRLVDDVLSVLTEVGTGWAVLHGEEEVARGEIESDVDLVIRVPMAVVLRGRFTELLRHRSVYPVIYWPYDVAGTATVFFTNEDASAGVQIDTLHDPHARGKFGIRTDVLLDNAGHGEAWPRVEPPFSLLYQVRKRHWKGQHEQIPGLREQLRAYPAEEIRFSAGEMFDSDTRHLVLELVDGADPTRFPREAPAYRVRNLARRFRRLASPVGAWVEFAGPEAEAAADRAVERFGRLLNVTRRADRPTGHGVAVWWVRSVAPVRWRPGLVVGVGGGGRPMPDLTIRSDHAATAVHRLVLGLSERVAGG